MILTLGNPVYDYIETKKVKTAGRVLSGCSTNAALTLARLNRRVTLVGTIGDDFKSSFADDMKRYGIDAVTMSSGETGGFSLIYYDNFGNRHLDLLGRADPIMEIDGKLLENAEAVLIGPILKEISFDLIRNIRRRFSGLFFCDPQGLLRGANENGRIYHEKPDGIEEILAMFDIVKPNELEAKVLTGIDCRRDPFKAARIIKSWGPKLVVVTLAELGSIIYNGRDFIEIPPYEVDLVDSTGAGDAYMGGFTHAYLSGKSLRDCGTFASCISSIIIEQVGPDFGLNRKTVQERQISLNRKTDFRLQLCST
jgi:sugar/nucleoside kinase (ribokinase family)